MRDSAREVEMETARTAPRAEEKKKCINSELRCCNILNKNAPAGNKQKRRRNILLRSGGFIQLKGIHSRKNKQD
ncbi:hypothetical protein CXU22_01765 [Akkermansia muciniphila]|uniref:Uncharacterized protein n=1 Tax=Akkermansia muciniphila TaxID=239935 RepID=A0A2N8HG95_9BACT|nr:hypothetical protein CXU22_01765 [Akkermansia muciniphila]